MPSRNFISRTIVPALGMCGLLYASYFTIAQANAPEAPPLQLNLPLENQYDHALSGSGLIEANTRNIVVGSHVPGVIQQVLVTEGDVVQAGAPLFVLDDRTAKAQILVSEAELAAAKVALADQKDQMQRADQLTRGISVTTDKLERLQFAVATASANVDSAKARLDAAQVTLAKLTVTAPVTGRVLKVNIRAGNFVEANGSQTPVVLGNDDPLYVRVSIDENDVWRLQPGAEARGALRGNRDIKFPLKFVRIEPYVIPKKSLTGTTTERVDTRIIEVLYEVSVKDQPLYIGQLVDVFIKAEK
ncbi:MAG: efflux RND transporter periplasmic adaptor subunit [Alphaproteobacteria bacterium]|nr:efflux RND transporter periplasmic adaptor subunit [Alphaproteobacteria bacterium]